MSRIEGKVAKVLNSREVAINRGEDSGVEVGMKFAVLNRNGLEIVDPDTGEKLDSVEVEKTVVKIVRTTPRTAVGRTFRTTTTRAGVLYTGGLLGLSQPPRKIVETLRTDETTYKEEIEEEDTYVKTGDPVVEVTGEEFSD